MLRNLAVGAAILGATLMIGAEGATASDGWGDVDENSTEVRDITYPLGEDAGAFVDTWLYPRGSRRHVGTDIIADKLVPLLAANAGCITYLDYGGPGGGNMLSLTDEDGWEYRYIHINNDSPGTDDGANPYEWAFVDGLEEGDCVERGQHISYVGDSGNAEASVPQLHFEVRRPDGLWINPFPSVEAAKAAQTPPPEPDPDPDPDPEQPTPDPAVPTPAVPVGTAPAPTDCMPSDRTAPVGTPSDASGAGYWLLDDRGVVHAIDSPHYGDLSTVDDASAPVSMISTRSGEGYWIVDTNGAIYSFGDAGHFGDMAGIELNGPVQRIEAAPAGDGYWLVGDDGGVFSFGQAAFHGSAGAINLNAPVISMSATANGNGYWLVASDGGVFTFGAATFRGSTGALRLAAPVIDMAVAPSGDGYWLYASDGGVFSFGADFYGSAPGLGRCDLSSAVALKATDTGEGYWIATQNGEVLPFGDAKQFGNAEATDRTDIVDMAVRHVSVDGPGSDSAEDAETSDD
ncbi:MAG: M23 family metallopeptidase [Actinobacteria bacterium]|nr:M23 family metallopeptidase [Actinomycetota bacterium]